MDRQTLSRREEYAEATKQAILDAARSLFAEQGYFATKVDEIASRARVSPATVYAVCGGKQGLLRKLMDIWTTDPIVALTIESVRARSDGREIVDAVAAACRRMREMYGDVMRVMLATAPHDQFVSDILAVTTQRYRDAFKPMARHLLDLGALRAELDLQGALDIFWFYFGYSGLNTLHDENGWTYDRAERWLGEQASRALLRS
ncbi:MAG: helix-turn-helix domain-containing protein [Rhizomicrobium sp.]